MFLKRAIDNNKAKKLAAPREIPEWVIKYLLEGNKINADIAPFFRAVVRAQDNSPSAVDVRIFDPNDAEARGVAVKDYNTLTDNPGMIIGEGWMDEKAKKVEIAISSRFENPRLFTEAEILSQIESLQTPGSRVFFFMAAGPSAGGPLGRGATVIQLNDNKDPKRKKKYLISTVNIIDGKPSGDIKPFYDSDKAKEVAKWVSEGHKKRFC
jgi:hypothetical protein